MATAFTDWVNGQHGIAKVGDSRHVNRNSKYQHSHHLMLIGRGNCLGPMDLESTACRFTGRRQAIRGVGE